MQKQEFETFDQNNNSIVLIIYEPDENYKSLNCYYANLSNERANPISLIR